MGLGRLKSFAKAGLKSAGFEVINLNHNERFGWDWMRDASRLAPLVQANIETIFDVGANTGMTALELERVFAHASIHSFEPTPATYQELCGNVAGHSRISTYPIALGPSNGVASLQCFDVSLLNSCAPKPPFIEMFPQAGKAIEVPMQTIDAFCTEHRIARISILKIDAEGFDLEVLKGARRMLGEGCVDFVVTEFNGASADESGSGNDLFSILREIGPAGFRFVTTYIDGAAKSLPLYLISNALFIRAPEVGS